MSEFEAAVRRAELSSTGGAEFTVDIRDRWSEEWNQFVQAAVRSRLSLIDSVAWFAYTQNLPYGVLVDCDGVRLDRSVPALTIHYQDTNCGPGHATFTADFTLPE